MSLHEKGGRPNRENPRPGSRTGSRCNGPSGSKAEKERVEGQERVAPDGRERDPKTGHRRNSGRNSPSSPGRGRRHSEKTTGRSCLPAAPRLQPRCPSKHPAMSGERPTGDGQGKERNSAGEKGRISRVRRSPVSGAPGFLRPGCAGPGRQRRPLPDCGWT